MEKVRITLIDDHQLFRKGVEAMLRSFGNIEIIYESGSAREFLDWLSEGSPAPEVVLLDIEMPGMNGIELMKILRTDYPAIKVIILSMHFRQSLVSSMVEAGVSGYLSKNCEPGELFNAIFAVRKSDFYFNDAVLRIMHGSLTGSRKKSNDVSLGFGITEREREVLELICKECTTSEIAEKLCLSDRTVEGHRNNLLQKTHAKNAAGLVLFAVRNNIVDPWF